MAGVDRESVMVALREVIEPDTKRDIVSSNFVRDVEINGDSVSLRLVLNTPMFPGKAKIEALAREAVLRAPGAKSFEITMNSEISKGAAGEGKQPVAASANIVAVSSGKGGVVKSSVCVNFAI